MERGAGLARPRRFASGPEDHRARCHRARRAGPVRCHVGQRADAKAKPKQTKVTKGPKGLKFYKPPKKLPKQHGTLIWARKATGLVPLADARYTKLVLYSSRTPQGPRPRFPDR